MTARITPYSAIVCPSSRLRSEAAAACMKAESFNIEFHLHPQVQAHTRARAHLSRKEVGHRSHRSEPPRTPSLVLVSRTLLRGPAQLRLRREVTSGVRLGLLTESEPLANHRHKVGHRGNSTPSVRGRLSLPLTSNFRPGSGS